MGVEAAAAWSDQRRHRAAEHLRADMAREQRVSAARHPAELASLCDPDYVITPMIDLASRTVEQALNRRRSRLMITASPQEGKSRLCAVWTPIRALQLRPWWRVMLLTFADGLAEEHSLAARAVILEYGTGVVDSLTGSAMPDMLGLSLHPDKATASNWRINEGTGGMMAAGRDATITGRPADLLIIDDPFKNMVEAESAAIRAKVIAWYHSVAETRLAPDASVILINTRWHPEDLSGHLLKQDAALPREQREWRLLNFPAVSHPAHPDALNRPEPGIAMVSARGRTAEDFQKIRRSVGERIWNALYQGSPTVPEGGLFHGDWFDRHRLSALPDRTRLRVVAVDPAESGEGDEAGVVAAALLYPPPPPSRETQVVSKLMAGPDAPEPAPEIYPEVVLTHDRSAQMTSDQWAKAAVDLALETFASDIVVEAYTAGDTYMRVVRSEIEARLRHVTDNAVKAQLSTLRHRVRKWRGTGDSVARSGALRQAVEVGTCVVLAEEMTVMEEQAKTWLVGRHQPDRVAAAVIAHSHLMTMAGKAVSMGNPARTAGAQPGAQWLSRKVG